VSPPFKIDKDSAGLQTGQNLMCKVDFDPNYSTDRVSCTTNSKL